MLSDVVSKARLLLAAFLVMTVSAAAWADCWLGELTPEERVCCLAMGHDCDAAGMEMSCCQAPEPAQDHSVAAFSTSIAAPEAPVVGPFHVDYDQPFHDRAATSLVRAFELELSSLPRPPTYLRLSALLI